MQTPVQPHCHLNCAPLPQYKFFFLEQQVNQLFSCLQLSYWICSEICSVRDAKTRGLLIEKFIDVARVRFYKILHCTVKLALFPDLPLLIGGRKERNS